MQHFRTRVSVILLAVIGASILPVVFLDQSTNPDNSTLAYGIIGVTVAFVCAILFTLRYNVGENHLIVKIGPITYCTIKLSDIESITRSYNPLSSPASSLKRLLITSKNKNVLISPSNETAFIQLLTARNSNIKVRVADKNDWWRFWNWDV